MSETRADIKDADKGCLLEDTSRSVVAGSEPHPVGVVMISNRSSFQILWPSGRTETIYRDGRSRLRLGQLRVLPKGYDRGIAYGMQ